jgi:cell division control protein 6
MAERGHKIFLSREAMSSDYIPVGTPHRNKEIQELGEIVAPALTGGRISNTFIYGKTGTGKTLVARQVMAELEKASKKVTVLYVNCKMKSISDTEYRLLAELARMLGRDVPSTGLPTNQIYETFYDAIRSNGRNIILVLDEIDALVKKIGDGIIYNLTRMNQEIENVRVFIIGISNDVSFTDSMDPRVKSSLSEEELVFPPYNANQLRDILKERSSVSFHPGVVMDGVIPKCAALAAQEHGDARKALDLLRIAGEIAERSGSGNVRLEHVDAAEKKLDIDTIVAVVQSQPKQSLAVLASIVALSDDNKKNIQTGDIFTLYEKICAHRGLKALTQRRISDLIAELDMMGVITTKVISLGRHGRTREIRISHGAPIMEKIRSTLRDNYMLDGGKRFYEKC